MSEPLPSALKRPEPSSNLLDGLRCGLPGAWQRLHAVYAPVIACWCRRQSLQQADVEDIVQDVLTTPALVDFRRAQEGGSFVAFLFTITRSRLVDHWRRQQRQPVGAGGSDARQRQEAVAEPAAEDEASDFRMLALRRALDIVQPEVEAKTWAAFWRTVIDGQDIALVAEQLQMTPGAVRVAKCRVLQRLRDELE